MADGYEFRMDVTSFKTVMDRIQSRFPNFIRTVVARVGARLLAKVKMLTPVDTGLLRRSWFLTRESTPSEVKVGINNNMHYAESVEFGHSTRGGGRVAGRFMLKRAMAEMNEQAPQILQGEIQDFINKNNP